MGGGITAILFTIGKAVIGAYVGRAGVGSAYGAAGSLEARGGHIVMKKS
jgi:membrane protein